MIRIEPVNKDTQLPCFPKRQTVGSVGFDLAAAEYAWIEPGEVCLVPTGLRIKVDKPGYFLAIVSRSSLPLKKNLMVANGIGIVDKDYCGPSDEIKVQLLNFGKEGVSIIKGDRIAQAIVLRYDACEIVHGIDDEQDRGGFGSTGGYGQ